jgi:hypothetical protein
LFNVPDFVEASASLASNTGGAVVLFTAAAALAPEAGLVASGFLVYAALKTGYWLGADLWNLWYASNVTVKAIPLEQKTASC